jgi:hypothetical protein
MANTRYTFSELLTAQAIGVFSAGKTVTIEVIDPATDTKETLISAACTPLTDDPAVYVWPFSNLQTLPAVFTQLEYVMTDNSTPAQKRREMIDCGGWVELVVTPSTGVPPADTCKITTTLFQPDGSCVMDTNDLFPDNQDNHIELRNPYFGNSRYFKLGKYKPSYDQLLGIAFWVMPQGATVDVKVDSIGVGKKDLVVPASVSIDLAAWIASAP